MAKLPFLDNVVSCPSPFDLERAARTLEDLRERSTALDSDAGERLREVLADGRAQTLIAALAGNSPYLARVMVRAPLLLARLLTRSSDEARRDVLNRLDNSFEATDSTEALAKLLRQLKTEAALLCALADVAGLWDWAEVTATLSRVADLSVANAFRRVLLDAANAGRLTLSSRDQPDRDCGIIVLAMGKLGASELNYSSDIDLIVFYEKEHLRLPDDAEPAKLCVRLTQNLVKLIQEQTVDGYCFRVDLRLRPDAGATQIAISTEAAELYYESMGQNWERAAMIKARPIAGDFPLGGEFISRLRPFVYRKYLDYAAIEDIHSIKRQIHAHQGHGTIRVRGHNIKVGRGGIREIEFFVQTQQLIMGGRIPALRERRTVNMLHILAERKFISPETATEMEAAYAFLRKVEHRMQMIDDQQTHTLPDNDEGVAHVACFMGYDDNDVFKTDLRRHLECVQTHYVQLFESAPPLSEKRGSLVFTGVEDDPETIKTLAGLGFSRPSDVAGTIRGWHHGRIRATRSERAREKLTALMPALLEALSKTANPDAAFAGMDKFLSGVPSGVQLFAMLYANPSLLGVLADAFGTAPRLATHLGRTPSVLDALLDPGFLTRLPAREELDKTLAASLGASADSEDVLDQARRWQREQMLRIGLQLVRGPISAMEAGDAFASVAEAVINGLLPHIARELERQHGKIRGGEIVIVALGKLGGREVSATSDLDLLFVYDCPEDAMSSGSRQLHASQYYARLFQRLINALTALTGEGRLYEVDMRLRPSGNKGPVATKLDGFIAYHEKEAWTWERLAMTRSRLIAGGGRLADAVNRTIVWSLTHPRDPQIVLKDALEMRARLEKEFGTDNIWELKYARGGLIDLEFIAQTLILMHASKHPEIIDANTMAAFGKLEAANIISKQLAEELTVAAQFIHNLNHALKIAVDDPFDASAASLGLKALLTRVAGEASFQALEERLKATQTRTRALFRELLGWHDLA
jgi:[glutamine synthetase] adenylyltransferase / [glutamine synthetase]-adenylyl-L-tyrosine phosphorylase